MEPSFARLQISPRHTRPLAMVCTSAEELFGMMGRVQDEVIVSDQLVLGILADGAELVVDIGDGALHVGGGDDRVLVRANF